MNKNVKKNRFIFYIVCMVIRILITNFNLIIGIFSLFYGPGYKNNKQCIEFIL